jgi:hypothetical protein
MRRLLIIAALLVGCGCTGHQSEQPKTRLKVVVSQRDERTRHYTLTCHPSGGSAPNAADACDAIENFLRPDRQTNRACSCALYMNRITVTGVLDGTKLSGPQEVSACAACGVGDSRAIKWAAAAFAAFDLPPG